jgi:hypothetical protein
VNAKDNPKFNIGTENPFKRSVSSSSRITGNTVFSQANSSTLNGIDLIGRHASLFLERKNQS